AWKAQDKNLSPRSVKVCYAEQPAGPWKTIVADLDDCGQYDWKKPADLPKQVYVRVEALDKAGNVGFAQSPQAICGGVLDAAAAVDGHGRLQQTSFTAEEGKK